jgi:hypothetical protein
MPADEIAKVAASDAASAQSTNRDALIVPVVNRMRELESQRRPFSSLGTLLPCPPSEIDRQHA